MFLHNRLNLIFPQFEHLRLVGDLALHWSNESFDLPAFDYASFLKGVALHDFGYGETDIYSILDMTIKQRLQAFHNLVHQELGDPIANLVAQHHVMRLMGDDPTRVTLKQICEAKIAENLRQVNINREEFLWADRITDFCDTVSFDFCLGWKGRTIKVFPRQGSTDYTELTYVITESNQITITPWVFNRPHFRGYIIGYAPDNYPKTLKPTLISYEIMPGGTS